MKFNIEDDERAPGLMNIKWLEAAKNSVEAISYELSEDGYEFDDAVNHVLAEIKKALLGKNRDAIAEGIRASHRPSQVICDTVELSDPAFQQYLKDHDISCEVIGDNNGHDEVRYEGKRKALLQMLIDFFGAGNFQNAQDEFEVQDI